jgi:hypothetical protein
VGVFAKASLQNVFLPESCSYVGGNSVLVFSRIEYNIIFSFILATLLELCQCRKSSLFVGGSFFEKSVFFSTAEKDAKILILDLVS